MDCCGPNHVVVQRAAGNLFSADASGRGAAFPPQEDRLLSGWMVRRDLAGLDMHFSVFSVGQPERLRFLGEADTGWSSYLADGHRSRSDGVSFQAQTDAARSSRPAADKADRTAARNSGRIEDS